MPKAFTSLNEVFMRLDSKLCGVYAEDLQVTIGRLVEFLVQNNWPTTPLNDATRTTAYELLWKRFNQIRGLRNSPEPIVEGVDDFEQLMVQLMPIETRLRLR